QVSLPTLGAGPHELLVNYGGDSDLEPSSVTVRELVILPAVSVAGTQVLEGDSGTTAVSVAVTLSAAVSVPVRVSFVTIAGSATSGVDFEAASGVIEFAPGEQTHA